MSQKEQKLPPRRFMTSARYYQVRPYQFAPMVKDLPAKGYDFKDETGRKYYQWPNTSFAYLDEFIKGRMTKGQFVFCVTKARGLENGSVIQLSKEAVLRIDTLVRASPTVAPTPRGPRTTALIFTTPQVAVVPAKADQATAAPSSDLQGLPSPAPPSTTTTH